MLVSDFLTELGNRIKTDPVAQRLILLSKINESYKEVARAYDWEHLKRHGEIVTIPNYTTGTCTITNASNTVTGTGTWTSAMEGRFFKPQGSSKWYRISKVQSATQLTLLSPIQETSASAQTYVIWKRFYYLPSEVRKILNLGSWIRDGFLTAQSIQQLQDGTVDISLTGEPENFIPYGADPFERSYSDGTISSIQNDDLLTGSGTSWLANAEQGDIITVGETILRVKRVESDTAIRLTTKCVNAISAGSTYVLSKDNPIGIQFYFNANSSYVFPLTYSKRVYNMLNDKDRPELPEEFDSAILDGAEASRLRDLNDSRWVNKLNEYAARVRDLKSERFVVQPRSRTMPVNIMTRGGYI